jgi:thiol-disulfide isomerase/thioredoxin
MDESTARDEPHLLVACLCAQWCGTCRDYRATLDALAAQLGAQARFVWVDTEDDDEALGSIDIQDFPTILIASGDQVRFFGPITPQPQTLTRLVHSAISGDLGVVADPTLAGLAARVRALGR